MKLIHLLYAAELLVILAVKQLQSFFIKKK